MITCKDIAKYKQQYQELCHLYGWDDNSLQGLVGYIRTLPYRGIWASCRTYGWKPTFPGLHAFASGERAKMIARMSDATKRM